VMKQMGAGKRGPLGGLANMLGMGGAMPKPEDLAKLAGGLPGLPPMPGLPRPGGLPGLSGKLPGGSGVADLGKGFEKKK
jgi:signal recognition particle subunit SRP54